MIPHEKLDWHQTDHDSHSNQVQNPKSYGTKDEQPQDYKKVQKLVSDIYNSGIEIKNLENGLIDFPSIRPNGEEVFLCWKLDEKDIEFWHGIKDGFDGRHHIDAF